MPPFARLALVALVVGGCADTVDPTLGTEQAFSLYGYLDPTADRQAIRVVPVVDALEADTARVLDATVTSVEPATGRTVTWRDSVVTFADGSIGHIFVADYAPTPGATVALAVRASDGGAADVTVAIPPLVRPTVGEPLEAERPGLFPVSVAGVPRLFGGALHLTVRGLPGVPPDSTAELEVPIPARDLALRPEGGGWAATVPFVEAVRAHLREIGLFDAGLTLERVEFRPFVANEAWDVPPEGLDEDAIVEPGTFSNVEGGFGFVGAGYRAPVGWVPSPGLQVLAGFSTVAAPAAQLAINEIGDGYVEMYNPTGQPIQLGGYILTTGSLEDGFIVPVGSVVEAGAFFVVRGPFRVTAGMAAQLFTGSGRLVKQAYVNFGAEAWGAYPDGYSYRPPQAERDRFYGPVIPSPGGPNRLPRVPAIVNEVSSDADPFVEIVLVDFELDNLKVAAIINGELHAELGHPEGGQFRISEEAGRDLLDPLGGEVYILALGQVVDARAYGPRAPGRSEGLLPDGPNGDWTAGLRPTRGAANRTARFGL